MTTPDCLAQSMEQACNSFSLAAAAAATPALQQFADACQKIDPLELMGFNSLECQQITEAGNAALAAGMGVGPLQLGRFIQNLQPLPEFKFNWKDFFAFCLHWREVARQALILTLVLALVAMTGYPLT